MKKVIFFLFAILIFFVPLVLWPYTSEVFEFNKMVLVYALTVLIAAAWLSRCVVERRIVFRRTILDIPLLVFLGSQIISTFLSIDFYTSIFGYYSRFNGGLLSTICYLVLYWAFVSNFDRKDTVRLIKIWFASAILVSAYGVAEHFGIDKNIWVQDVQSRVFSSLGQPNWLAAWVVALIPLAWSKMLNTKKINAKFIIYLLISILLFVTLLFTKSRSGLAGFLVADAIFWIGYFYLSFKNDLKRFFVLFVICHLIFGIFALVIGTQYTPSLSSLINHSTIQPVSQTSETALETGGTESSVIRKIVWTGALQVWLHYPIFGTGVETFAYSYYLYRPVAHNLTSEWDFIYNKAHNEFLNMAANSGTVGLISYLVLIGFSIFVFIQKSKNGKSMENEKLEMLNIGLLAGYISLSVSNFFGFSVVPTQLEFFLFPAIAIAFAVPSTEYTVLSKKLGSYQKILIFFVLCTIFYVLWLIANYWNADILYNQGKNLDSIPRPDLAIPNLTEALKLEPSQAIYYGELANSYATVAMAYSQNKNATTAAEFTNLAIESVEQSVTMAPANVNLRRTMFGVYVRLSTIDEKYLVNARNSLIETIKLASTDPKLEYNLGIADANLGQNQAALSDFQKAIELKANYTDARIEYAALLVHLGKNTEAKEQLNYILAKIDPGNSTAREALANIK